MHIPQSPAPVECSVLEEFNPNGKAQVALHLLTEPLTIYIFEVQLSMHALLPAEAINGYVDGHET